MFAVAVGGGRRLKRTRTVDTCTLATAMHKYILGVRIVAQTKTDYIVYSFLLPELYGRLPAVAPRIAYRSEPSPANLHGTANGYGQSSPLFSRTEPANLPIHASVLHYDVLSTYLL